MFFMHNLDKKKMFMRVKLLFSLLLSTVLCAKAQSSGTINGTVVTDDNHPLPAVTVSILSATDSTAVIATSTNDFGKYSLKVSAKGDYLVRFSIVGYETKFFGPFHFPGNINITEPIQTLKSVAANLSVVSVTAKKSVVENQQGK